MKKYLILIMLFIHSVNHAQFNDIFASEGDANKYITNFTQPVFKGLMYASNSAWITSAKPIKPFHAELNISASGALIKPEFESFVINNSDYNYLQVDSGPNEVPTVMGGESQTHLTIEIPDPANNEKKVFNLYAPNGIKDQLPASVVPAPAVQLSVGLPLGTEVNLRYAPNITKDGGFFNLLGAGVKHSITQYFPRPKDENGKKKKRNFNVAIHGAFQKINAGYDAPNSDKGVHLSISTLSLQGIASLDYKLISLYSAIGYSKGFTSMDVLGTYTFTYDVQDNNGNHIRTDTSTLIDPLSLNYNLDGLKAKAGVKLNLFVFQVFADYTIQEFPVLTAGIGFKY